MNEIFNGFVTHFEKSKKITTISVLVPYKVFAYDNSRYYDLYE